MTEDDRASTPPGSPGPVTPRESIVGIVPPAVREAASREAALRPAEAAPKKVAVLVVHGMGQQVPFETLELVAKALLPHAVPHRAGGPPIEVEKVQLGQQQLPRAEMRIRKPDGTLREVHFYESYWAPLTEGKVTLRDVMLFLLRAGLQGIWNSEAGGHFERWMFGAWQPLSAKSRHLMLRFVAVLLVALALLVLNTTIVAVAASHTLTGGESKWPGSTLLRALTVDILIIDVVAILLYLGVAKIPARALRRQRQQAKPRELPNWVRALSWTLVWLGLAGVTLMAFVILYHLAVYRLADGAKPFAAWEKGGLVIVWGLAVAASAGARVLLVQYIGDVAAYVSAHTVSKFWEVRKQIQAAAERVMQAVYETQTGDPPDFVYEKVVVVGHSLGSLIAYDVLNDLLNDEMTQNRQIEAARRTTALITFGSPMDKTAFIFRRQKPRESDVREALAAAEQPLIVRYANRPRHWINLWSRNDWISGRLEYYDDWLHPRAGGGKRIHNWPDPQAASPLVAHIEYWESKLFARMLYRAIGSA